MDTGIKFDVGKIKSNLSDERQEFFQEMGILFRMKAQLTHEDFLTIYNDICDNLNKRNV